MAAKQRRDAIRLFGFPVKWVVPTILSVLTNALMFIYVGGISEIRFRQVQVEVSRNPVNDLVRRRVRVLELICREFTKKDT